MATSDDTYISVDIETSGPNPGTYSLLSIGACDVFHPSKIFYIELQPINENRISSALRISGLDWESLKKDGHSPADSMEKFNSWLLKISPPGKTPTFVAFNAPFDWMFINDYFHRYLGHNPFGHKAIDIKALYMGLHRVSWEETSMHSVAKQYLNGQTLKHHALRDALDQAVIFREMLMEITQ